jgi:hypothetical protein
MTRGGRPPHQPDDRARKQVESMASYQIPQDEIARVMQITPPTLRKHYAYELETAHVRANALVAQSLFQKAIGSGPGSVVACIFWLKARAGWREALPPNEEFVEEKLGKKEAAIMAAQNPDSGSTLGELMVRRQLN